MENINSIKESRNLKLEAPVVIRKVPMTAAGCDMLRAIRKYQTEQLEKQQGISVDIPFPTAIHLVLADYCKLKGIEIE